MTPAMMARNGAIFGIDSNFSFQLYRKSAAQGFAPAADRLKTLGE